MSKFRLFIVAFACTFITLHVLNYKPTQLPEQPAPQIVVPYVPPTPVAPTQYTIGTIYPDRYLDYDSLVNQLKTWNKEAPEITEFGTYGKTQKGTDCCYLRVGTPGKPKLLIHACIHGNERLSAATEMATIGRYLSEYGRNEKVTWLIKNRDIYFVPALSPDTYLKSRHVENVDPNRSYPCPARPNGYPPTPIKLIMEFTNKHKFQGVISNHTYGREYMTPSLGPREDRALIKELAQKMSDISGYGVTSLGSGGDGNGYDADWYYLQGACALLIEWGRGPHEMPYSDVKIEFEKNYEALLLFFKEAPEVKAKLKLR